MIQPLFNRAESIKREQHLVDWIDFISHTGCSPDVSAASYHTRGVHMIRQLRVTSRHVFADALELLITVGEERCDEPLVLNISFARSRFRFGVPQASTRSDLREEAF
jgi:hypothetical protein